jgi:ABC-type Fe3+/spermidine/putrescine transport system ATPase subunit
MTEIHTLSIDQITKNYENKPLLKGISFEVQSGDVLCLLGRSGSGKSTLLRIIAGIESADAGCVLWDGEDLSTCPTEKRHFGLMFQDYALFPHRNVAENVAFGLRMQKLPEAEIDQRVREALARVNMSEFAHRQVTDLSGGEQQRVALARTLAPEPRLIMLDEPLAALDRTLREQLQQELREVLHNSGIPAIYVTHDQEEALALGDRLALLNEGCIVQMGKPEEIYRWPQNRWVAQFLGMQNGYPGSILSTAPLVIQTGSGQFKASTLPGNHFAVSEKVFLVVTPTGDFSPAENSSINQLQGICRKCQFKGELYQIQLQLKDGSQFIYSSNRAIPVGEMISLQIPSDNLICLKNETPPQI